MAICNIFRKRFVCTIWVSDGRACLNIRNCLGHGVARVYNATLTRSPGTLMLILLTKPRAFLDDGKWRPDQITAIHNVRFYFLMHPIEPS